MSEENPIYDTYDENATESDTDTKGAVKVRVVRSIEDYMRVVAIRSAVYLSEQKCPYREEFDGNDFCATHLLAYRACEPIGCIRVRFFSDFAKVERLTVRHEFRNTRASFCLVKAVIELAKKKGYKKLYGHAQDRLQNFWGHFGWKPLHKNYKLVFSDFCYTEMLLEVEPHPEPITIHSDPYVIIRPEGAWHRPGILDKSASRPATSPIRELQVA